MHQHVGSLDEADFRKFLVLYDYNSSFRYETSPPSLNTQKKEKEREKKKRKESSSSMLLLASLLPQLAYAS